MTTQERSSEHPPGFAQSQVPVSTGTSTEPGGRVVYVEAQYDPRRRTMLLQASACFGDPHPYRVVIADVSHDEGKVKAQEFVCMYRDLGCRVST